ncbi:MAG: hypothetical protein M3N37_03570 [Actinomycetota bacterium]|nr:hypothetical protein [Actinomycetota bacterium]
MRGAKKVESGKDRKMFARDAGMGPVSLLSILAGTLVAFSSFAILLAVVGGILAAVGVDTATLTANDYQDLGIGGAVVAGLVLFLSYFFGGYIAGRLARRAGALNGGLVLVLAILIGAVVAVLVGTQADTEAVADNLRVIGVPTSASDYSDIATVAGIVALVAMIAGAVLGGIVGERWHGKLAARAFDPNVGPESAARQEVTEAEHRRSVDYHRPEPEESPHRARRPWATQQPTAQETTSQAPAYQRDREDSPSDRPSPASAPTSSGWSDAESRAWGTSSPQPTGSRAEQGDDPATAEDSAGRPRRERPLRRRA